MNGLDVLVFTGGVGEHSPRVRAAAADGLEFLGVSLDPAQDSVSADADISGSGPARVLVVTAREDIEIARQARAVLAEHVTAGGWRG
jgi:acetate kinase